MSHRETPPPKKDVARALLLRGSVFVYLDPRAEGVSVPPWLARQPQLVLQVGLDLPVPIPDLRVDDTGVFGTLSFNRAPFTCSVPWSAVFALVGDDGMGMVWREDLPEEIASEVEQGLERAEAPRRPQLRAIPGGAAGEVSEERSLEAVPDLDEEPPRGEPHEPPAGEGEHEGDDGDPSSSDDGGGDDGGDDGGPRLPPYLRVIK